MNGKIKVQGMTLVEVIVAIALFAIFLSFGFGLLEMTFAYNHRMENKIQNEQNAEGMIAFMREEIGLAESVRFYVDRDGDPSTKDEVALSDVEANTPQRLIKVVLNMGEEDEQILFVNHGKMTFQGEQVGTHLNQVLVSRDDLSSVYIFIFEVERFEEEGSFQRIQIIEDLSHKK